MAEQSQTTGAIGGAAQGAAVGAQFGHYGAAIGAVFGGVAGFLSGGGEKEAKAAAREQARQIMRVAVENRRVEMRQANLAVSTARARTYASNIQDTGSTRDYRNALETEYRRGIDFSYQTAKTNANTAIAGGKVAAGQIKKAGVSQMIGGLTSLGTSYAGGSFSSAPVSKPDTGPVTGVLDLKTI